MRVRCDGTQQVTDTQCPRCRGEMRCTVGTPRRTDACDGDDTTCPKRRVRVRDVLRDGGRRRVCVDVGDGRATPRRLVTADAPRASCASIPLVTAVNSVAHPPRRGRRRDLQRQATGRGSCPPSLVKPPGGLNRVRPGAIVSPGTACTPPRRHAAALPRGGASPSHAARTTFHGDHPASRRRPARSVRAGFSPNPRGRPKFVRSVG